MERTDPQTVSNSEVDTYRQCRLKHQLSYIERWRDEEEHEALARGTLFHTIMEHHYRALKDGAPCRYCEEGIFQIAGSLMVCSTCGANDHTSEVLFRAVAPYLYEEDTGNQSERQELVEWIYRGYVECYGLDDVWEIVGVEVPLDFPLMNADGTESEYRLAGTADLVVRDRSAGGGLWIVDHKTCKDLPKKDFDLEDQTAIYTYLLKLHGMDIRGAIYNHCRTYKLKTREMGMDERFLRQHTVRTDQELETCALEVLELMREAYGRDLKIKCVRCDGTGHWDDRDSTDDRMCPTCGGSGHLYRDAPRSPNGDTCSWKCGYTEACIAGRKYGPDRTRQFLKDAGFVQHDTKPGPTFNKERTIPA